jgi:ADP-heptose:LPS heptosyltransferase
LHQERSRETVIQFELSFRKPRRRDAMNIQLQRAVDRYVGVPMCALFSLVERLRGPKPSTLPPRKILIILLSEMGSLVLAHPMFAALKERYPEASLHVMLFAKNRQVLDLLGVVPEENVLTLDDSDPGRFLSDIFNAIRTMWALRFDVVIDCELFARVSAIFSYLSGAPVRVGFHPHTQEGLYRGSFMSRPVMYNPYRHLSQQFLTLMQAIESDSVPVAKTLSLPAPDETPMLVFAPGEVEEVTAALHADFPAIKDKPLVLVNPSGGILPIRAWSLENYQELCSSLLAEGYAVGVTGLPADRAIGETLVTRCESQFCVNLTGYTRSVRHLLALFHRASLLITNDGGPGQFAALTPVPSIIFFGPETPLLYRPLSSSAFCFHLQLSCSPCLTAYNHRTSACDGDNRCLKGITPGDVLAKAREILAIRRARPNLLEMPPQSASNLPGKDHP